jgi:hypothetical protein
MPAVYEMKDESEGFPFSKVSADELSPAFALRASDTRIPESGKIDEVEAAIYKVIVELLCLAGGAANACQGASSRQQIKQ